MSKRTAVNTSFKGLVEAMAIPAELHQRPDGRQYASFGSAIPIHCCTPEQVESLANTTHHYCALFTEQVLAPLGELAYVRLDDTTAEKVFINRVKRMLLISSDGKLAQWRCTPTFESANQYVAGTPIVNKDGALVSLVTAKRGNNYAVSTFEGEGGYFDTREPWTVIEAPEGLVYGSKVFPSREALREYVAGLPPAAVSADLPPRPALIKAPVPRIALEAANGRQLSHMYLQSVVVNDIEYL